MLQVEARTWIGELELAVELAIEAGQTLALVGPSGAGKTTVLRIVAGLLRPEHGFVGCGDAVWLDTVRSRNLAPERRSCGYVFQEYALFGHLPAWRNIAFGLRNGSRRQRRSRAVGLLARFGIEQLADARTSNLSGGERQRVALARALAREPQALLLDEPLAALDPRGRAHAGRELAVIPEPVVSSGPP